MRATIKKSINQRENSTEKVNNNKGSLGGDETRSGYVWYIQGIAQTAFIHMQFVF